MSAGNDGDPNPLIALFRQCVVCVTDEAEQFRGSGFFVAPGRVVTCGHVAHGVTALRVEWQGKVAVVSGVAAMPPLETVTEPASYPLPDLAVLVVDEAARWGHPCAALAEGQPVLGARDGLYLAGYTVEHGGVPALTGATTEFESLVSEDGHCFYKLKRGLVLPGFSGSPLLDLGSGLVAGITESSRGRQADLGGFAVPVAELAAFPRLLEASRAVHDEDDRWKAAAEAERVRAEERKGTRARLPLRPPVVALAPDEDLSPATVLRPRYAVVGYVGREELLGELTSWCEREPDDGSPVALWLVTGGGGFGKTRLAVEACREAEARGWTAGLLRSDVSEDGLRALAEWPGRLLIAIDYAESSPALVGRLTTELAARAPRAATRVMLLVRRRASRAELLELLNQQHEEELDALLRRASISRLEDAASEVDRLQLYRQAVKDLAPFVGPAPAGERSPLLRAAHFTRPLYVLAAAYLARASAGTDVDALDDVALLRALIDQHEAGHWERLDRHCQLGLDPADRRAAVAIATLLAAEGEEEALTVARLVPHLGAEPESRLIAVARWLARLYPAPREGRRFVVAPLEPDRLGEVLVGYILREHPGLLPAAIDRASDRQLTRALTVAGRIARDDQAVSAQLRDALDDRLGELFRRAFSAGGSDLLTAVTTAMTITRPARGAAAAAERFSAPPGWLRPLAVTVTALAVDGFRAQARNDPAIVPNLAGALNRLGNRLREAGRPQEALEAAREGVALYRQLAQEDPTAYLPNLALSLNNLSVVLNAAAQWQEALQVAREGVALYRRLTQEDPTAYLSGLAMSLNNLGLTLDAVGEQQEALETAREGVAIYRRLAQEDPAAHLPHLAGSLGNLAGRLMQAGQLQEALEAIREAVSIRRQVAQDSPVADLSELAMSLSNLGAVLTMAGEQQEALEAARDAVACFRQLAQTSPAAHLPDLARSLTNLAKSLSDAGERQEALTTAAEAVALYQQLSQMSPRHLPDLARSLINLTRSLSEAGERQAALAAASETVARFRELALVSPAYIPNLAASLTNLARSLSEAGERQAALAAADEAVARFRELALVSPAYVPELATSLNNLTRSLSEAGKQQEALVAAGEAVTLYRQLAQASPTHLPDLARSLTNLAAALDDASRPQEALVAADEAVALHRQLAQISPAYVPHLAASLNNLACLGDVSQRLKAAGEAVTLYRQLAQVSPAYVPDLARSLNNLAKGLSEAGQIDQAEILFADMLGDCSYRTSSGYVLLERGRWRAGQNRLADAIPDLAAAVSEFNSASNYLARGQARLTLRILREVDSVAFDQAWKGVNEELPVWLMHQGDSRLLNEKVIAWLGAADWDASRAYLEDNTADLLTDEAEAAVEHLIDTNPATGMLQEHLQLLKAARSLDTGTAYAAHHEQRQAKHLSQTLGQWLTMRTWMASRAFAADHSGELLHPVTGALLDALSDQDPANSTLRLHRGLLGYAVITGFDAAYDLLPDPNRQQAILADPATPAATRLAIARIHSGHVIDDPEAHYQLAVMTLLVIPAQADPTDPKAAAALAHQAAAALADCATNAAPWEQRDYIRRLTQLGTDHPPLAQYTAELQHILTSTPGDRPLD